MKLLLLLILVGAGASVAAEITAVSEQGFVSEHELVVSGSPQRVYAALTEEISQWWDPAHSYSGKGENFSLQARAGGCFCERLENGGSVEHMRVVFAAPGSTLRLQGGLGPLQAMGVQGTMQFTMEAVKEGRTRLLYRYAVAGYTTGGLAGIAEPVDQVQLGQLKRLAAYLDGSGLD